MTEFKQAILKHELKAAGFPNAGYKVNPDRMCTDVNNEKMPSITSKGDIRYYPEYSVLAHDTIRPIVSRVNEMIAAWKSAEPMPFPDVKQYRKLIEYKDTVLAARDDTAKGHGLHFVTWKYSFDRTGLEAGHYTEDFDSAKQDFAVRAGLIPQNKLLTREQVAEIKKVVAYRLDNDWDMTYEAEKKLEEILHHLAEGYSLSGGAVQQQPETAEKPGKTSLMEKLREKESAVKAQPSSETDKPSKGTTLE